MKATTLIERAHRNLQELCKAVDDGSPSVRGLLLPQLASDLMAHIAVEEQIFYPRLGEALGLSRPVSEGRARHRLATESLERALAASPDSPECDLAIRELAAVLDRHAREGNEALPAFESALDDAGSRALAREMMALYHDKAEEGCASNRVPYSSSTPPESASPQAQGAPSAHSL